MVTSIKIETILKYFLCFFKSVVVGSVVDDRRVGWRPVSWSVVGSCPAGMDASQMHLWDVSCSVSETSQRGLICKSERRLRWDLLKMSPQRLLWDLSGLLRRGKISKKKIPLKFYKFPDKNKNIFSIT